MKNPPALILLNTVGTSLFSNLKRVPPERAVDLQPLAAAHQARDWAALGRLMQRLAPTDPLLGAEASSIASMIEKQCVAADCGLYFFHSDTDDGRAIAGLLVQFFQGRGHNPVAAIPILDLQDKDPKRFRTHGLRNLARQLCQVIRDRSAAACAINATGGYKAQVAVGVLLGQAIGVPVYYKHELFSEIIAFPPMPVALDFEVWMKASGLLTALEGSAATVPAADYADEWDEKLESLVEREPIDGIDHLALSATGQIFHETFRERFRSSRDQFLPPAAIAKHEPVLEKSGWPGTHPDVGQFLQRITSEVPQVTRCATVKLIGKRQPTRFKLGQDGVEGIYDNGQLAVLFRVETTAQTGGQRAAMVAALNEWLAGQ